MVPVVPSILRIALSTLSAKKIPGAVDEDSLWSVQLRAGGGAAVAAGSGVATWLRAGCVVSGNQLNVPGIDRNPSYRDLDSIRVDGANHFVIGIGNVDNAVGHENRRRMEKRSIGC